MFGVSFLAPAFLLGLAAVVAPLLLHLFAREEAPVTTLPTLRFVPRAPVQQTRRRRPQDILLLLLRVAAIALLVLMFARPFLAHPGAAPEATLGIVAVDVSFSMRGGERQQQVRELARQAIESMPTGAQVALTAFDNASRVVVAPTASRDDVVAALAQLVPGYGSTSYGAAIRGALEVAKRQPAQLVLVTDGQRAGVDAEVLPLVPGSLNVSMMRVRPLVGNLSVDALEQVGDRLVAVVHNHALDRVSTEVRWLIDQQATGTTQVEIPPGQSVEVPLDRGLPARGVVTATVIDPTGYEADNARYAITDPLAPLPVLVLTGADAPPEATFYIRAALESASERRPVAVETVTANSPAIESGTAFKDARVVVVAGTRGLSRPGRDALRAAAQDGRGVLIAAGPDVEAGVIREVLGSEPGRPTDQGDDSGGSFRASDVRHPVLAALGVAAGNLGQVRVERAWTLKDADDRTTLLRFSNGRPALSEIALGRGRVFLLGTDVARRWNTWPLHPTFAPFLLESVRYLGGERSHEREAIIGADIDSASAPGVQTRAAGAGRVAVNVDSRESGVETVDPAVFVGSVERLDDREAASVIEREQETGQTLWRNVLWAVLAVLAIEALLASRPRATSGVSADLATAASNGEGTA